MLVRKTSKQKCVFVSFQTEFSFQDILKLSVVYKSPLKREVIPDLSNERGITSLFNGLLYQTKHNCVVPYRISILIVQTKIYRFCPAKSQYGKINSGIF